MDNNYTSSFVFHIRVVDLSPLSCHADTVLAQGEISLPVSLKPMLEHFCIIRSLIKALFSPVPQEKTKA